MLSGRLRLTPVAAGLALWLSLACSQVSRAQVPPLRQLPMPASLRDAPVSALLQDRRGYLWAATPRGLLLYTGAEMRLVTTRDSLVENIVTALFEDKQGRIWIGHKSGGITRYDGRHFERFSPPEGSPTKPIYGFTQDAFDNIWIASHGEGIYYASSTRVYLYSAAAAEDPKNALPDDNVYQLLAGKEGDVWAGTDAGMARLVPTAGAETNGKHRIESLSQKDGLPDNIVKHLALDTLAGVVWVTMQDSGVTTFNPVTRKFSRRKGFPLVKANATLPVKSGVWVALAEGGLLFWDRRSGRVQRLTTLNGLASDKSLCLLADREGAIWIGSEPGLTQILGERFQFLSSKTVRMPHRVTAVYQDRRGELWIGSDSGVTRLTPRSDGALTTRRYLAGGRTGRLAVISGITEDRFGNVWISSSGEGVIRIYPGSERIEQFKIAQGLPDTAVSCIVRDSTGSLWIGTLGGGVARLDVAATGPPRIRIFTSAEGLAGDYIYSITPSRDSKTIWVATAATGISRFVGGKWFNLAEKEGLTDLDVLAVREDSKGNVYALTYTQGVFQLMRTAAGRDSLAHLTTFAEEQGAQPRSMVIDGRDQLVLPDVRRLGVFNPTRKNLLIYDSEDGLREFDPQENASYIDRTGVVWVGTADGLVRFDPSALTPASAPPPVFLTRLLVNQNETTLAADTSLGPSQNDLTFYYTAANLSNPLRVVYSYRLLGSDSAWSPPSRNTFVSFPGQTDGEYTLEVRASTQEGIWGEPARYSFSINPPFWKMPLFWLVVAAVVIGGTVTYFRAREQRIRAENIKLEQKVQERTAEVVRQKTEIELKNQALEDANEEITTKNEQISMAFREIEQKNTEITESIQYARRIQQSILPDVERLKEYFADVGVYYQARDIVSGDFYWYAQSAGKVYLAAVDCTGHGVPGAFMSVMAYNLLNQTIKDFPGQSPDQFLHNLETSLASALQLRKDGEAGTQTNDGMDIALIQLDPATNTITFAGAMRPMYLIRNGEVQEFKGARFPIGGTQYGDKVFEANRVEIQPGDQFYLSSDGLVDQFGGPNGRKFTPTKLKKLLQEVQDRPLPEQAHVVKQSLEEWMQGYEQLDDLMLVGVRPL